MIFKVKNSHHDAGTGHVFMVDWEATAVNGSLIATAQGTQVLISKRVDAVDFVPFDQLTEEVLIGWVKSAMGPEHVQQIVESLEAQVKLAS